MSDVREALQELAEQAQAQARPPALAELRLRRSRRSAVRGAGALLAVAAVGVGAAGVLGPGERRTTDVVAAVPTGPAPSASTLVVPPGKVAFPPTTGGVLVVEPGAPPLADLLSSSPTPDGPLVTAGQRRGDQACTAVFVVGAPGAQGGLADCEPVTAPDPRGAGRFRLAAASTGASGGAVTSLVLHGSAPAGTRTVVLTGARGTSARVEVASAGPQYGERAYFALPWVEQDTVARALDADGRLLATDELLLAMGQG